MNFVSKAMMACWILISSAAEAAKREFKNLLRNKYSMIEYKGLLTCFGWSLDAQEGYEFLRKALRDMGGDTELQMVRTEVLDVLSARPMPKPRFSTHVGAMWA